MSEQERGKLCDTSRGAVRSSSTRDLIALVTFLVGKNESRAG